MFLFLQKRFQKKTFPENLKQLMLDLDNKVILNSYKNILLRKNSQLQLKEKNTNELKTINKNILF